MKRTRWLSTDMKLSRPGLTIVLLPILVSLVGVSLAQSASAEAPARDLSASLVARAAQVPALAVDKQVSTHQSAASSSISSPAMTPSQAGELIVAFIMSDGSATAKQTFSSVTGGGLSWSLRRRSNAQPGTSEIWQAVATTAVSNMVVNANRGSGSYTGSIVVTAVYVLRAARTIFWGPGPDAHYSEPGHELSEARGTEWAAPILLGSCLVLFGVWPRLLTDLIDPTTMAWLGKVTQVAAVLPSVLR